MAKRDKQKTQVKRKRFDCPTWGLFETAGTLGLSIDTVRRYAKSGRLPSVRIAGRIRIPREAVDKALREGI